MASVVIEQELLDAVDEAFDVTGRELEPWPDPHPDRRPREQEYSRLTYPARWRIVGARAEAWLLALRAAGLAEVERNAPICWEAAPPTVVSRADRLVPHVAGGLPLIVARSQLGPVDDPGGTHRGGVTPGVVTGVPPGGCAASDSRYAASRRPHFTGFLGVLCVLCVLGGGPCLSVISVSSVVYGTSCPSVLVACSYPRCNVNLVVADR